MTYILYIVKLSHALTRDNYNVAVTLLKQKFGKPDSIIMPNFNIILSTLNQYVETQENAQRHFANKGYGNEFKPVRYGESHQIHQNFN